MEVAIQRVISEMWDRYFEPINLGELASSVFVSPFHFLRIFTKTTGVTPGKYLSAIRMYEAKRLLLTTSLRVSDIVNGVGYRSLGTFTTRFTQAVGMTPSQYREPSVGELFIAVGPKFSRMPSLRALRETTSDTRPGNASIAGAIELPRGAVPANVLICVFREQVPRCAPVAHELLPNSGSGRFTIRGLPPGHCTVIAVAESQSETSDPILFAASPVRVIPGGTTFVRLRLRKPLPIDPPLAVSLAGRVAANTDRTAARDRRAA